MVNGSVFQRGPDETAALTALCHKFLHFGIRPGIAFDGWNFMHTHSYAKHIQALANTQFMGEDMTEDKRLWKNVATLIISLA